MTDAYGNEGPRRGGRNVQYQRSPGALLYSPAEIRRIQGSAELGPQDLLVEWSEPTPGVERTLTLPSIESISDGHTIKIQALVGGPITPAQDYALLRVVANPSDPSGLINQTYSDFIMLAGTQVTLRASRAADGQLWWYLDASDPGGRVAKYRQYGLSIAENTPAGTVINVPAPGTFAPWVSGTLETQRADLFVDNNGGLLNFRAAASGLYLFQATASVVGVADATVEMAICTGGTTPLDTLGNLGGGRSSFVHTAEPLRKTLSAAIIAPVGPAFGLNDIGISFTSDDVDTVTVFTVDLQCARL